MILGQGKKCKAIHSLLWDYSRGWLAEKDHEAVSAHLLECPACRQQARKQAQTARLFNATRASFASSSAAWQQLQQQMKERASHGEARRRVSAQQWKRAVAACCIVAATGSLAIHLFTTQHMDSAKRNANQRPFSADPKLSAAARPHVAPSAKGASAPSHSVAAPDAPNKIQAKATEIFAAPRYALSSAKAVSPFVAEQGAAQANSMRKVPAETTGRKSTFAANIPAAQDDLRTLNSDPANVLSQWTGHTDGTFASAFSRQLAVIERKIRAGDDFVYVPIPHLAAAGSNPQQQNRLMASALAAYRQEKEVVDARLARKVSMGAKSVSLDEVCKQLKQKTGVDVWAGKSVVDENITLYCDDQSLGEVMRQINRLFGFVWLRSGEEGHYRYQLWQNVRGQLAEEEMRNKDRDEALIDLDSKMANYKPDKRFPEWGALQLYNQFSPTDFAALRRGEEIAFAGWDKRGARPMPAEINKHIVAASNSILEPSLFAWPDYNATATMRLNFSEQGQVTLEAADTGVFKMGVGGYARTIPLATGLSPSSARPNNAQANKPLRAIPALARVVSLLPAHSCPYNALPADGKPRDKTGVGTGRTENAQAAQDKPKRPTDGRSQSLDRFNRGVFGGSHIMAADVWEEVHKRTGLPVIADSYTRLYPLADGTIHEKPLYEALNKVADALASRWKMEGAFLACRTANFFWNRMKEVPNHLLTRWQQNSLNPQGLPLNDFLEMADLSEAQLDSQIVGDAVTYCWGLNEWDALGRPIGYYTPRPFARYLAHLSPALRQQFITPEGVAFSDLSGDDRAEFVRAAQAVGKNSYIDFENMATCRYRMEYIPARVYVWKPGPDHKYQMEVTISDPTAEGALAKARKVDAKAALAQMVVSPGSFCVIQTDTKGEALLVAGVKSHLLFNAFKN